MTTDPNYNKRGIPGAIDGTYSGIMVGARHHETGNPGTYDIVVLDRDSLITWLNSRGGNNNWAVSTVLILTGHEPLNVTPAVVTP